MRFGHGPRRVRRLPSLAAIMLLSGATAAFAQGPSGRDLFLRGAQPPCATCHRLADAGATGRIGPNLDELDPSAERVSRALRLGIGNMPVYVDRLSDEEIETLSRYVAEASGR